VRPLLGGFASCAVGPTALPGLAALLVGRNRRTAALAPEDQEAIFGEFRQVGTVAKKVEGTRLGLALSRKFIELHEGSIWVKSPAGLDLHVHDPGAEYWFRSEA
jgi:light-regulated signal transduction histidine kinase (bacteriophytochrome)